MKKKIVLRGILGVPLGIAIGYLITVFISLTLGTGEYSPCMPRLSARAGSEISAVIWQTALCGLLGAGFGGSSVIWEIEQWGIVKQTGVYFVIASVIMLPVAYFAYWMEHSPAGVAGYFGVFARIFALVWAVQFATGKRAVKKMNEKLKRQK